MTTEFDQKIDMYVSHSWRADDVPLNVLVWDFLSGRCLLSVDHQGAALKKGSFFVNRLEYLIRQSDAFVSVLSYRPDESVAGAQPATEPTKKSNGGEEHALKCSKASLFELRLAERARKPRLVIYDSRTRFRQPATTSDLVCYHAIDAKREVGRGGRGIGQVVQEWLSCLDDRRDQGLFLMRNDVTILVDETGANAKEIEEGILDGLNDTRFSEKHFIRAHHLDSDVVGMLQSSDLFIAEVGGVDNGPLGVAHALFVPTIRLLTAEEGPLPSFLTGHPFGYERDIVLATEPEKVAEAIKERVLAMDEDRYLIKDAASGRAYFRSKLARDHKVFLSHNLKGDDTSVIQKIVNLFDENAISAWEYRNRMTSGRDWREKLGEAMADSTHVVFIADPEFESSPACYEELHYFRQEARFTDGHIFPFLWKRSRPIAPYSDVDNPALPFDSPKEAARIVADRVIEAIRGS